MNEKRERATAIIKIRVKPSHKKALLESAKKNGITLTEFIITRSRGGTIPDRVYDKTIFTSIASLTTELNRIGNNINQATTALHQINKNQKIEQGDFERFLSLLECYLQSREALKQLLLKTQFHVNGL